LEGNGVLDDKVRTPHCLDSASSVDCCDPAWKSDHSNLSSRLIDYARSHVGAAMDVGEWLRGLGSEKYEEIFRANAFDAAPHRRPPQAFRAAFLESQAIPTIR
jgi:hypothetical protein